MHTIRDSKDESVRKNVFSWRYKNGKEESKEKGQEEDNKEKSQKESNEEESQEIKKERG